MTLFIFEIKINVCVRCTLYVYWTVFGVAVVRDEERRFFLFIFQYADTHTEHFQNSKQSNYGYRNFLHLSFTILFCYWNGNQWRHTHRHIREIRYRKFNWNEHNRETFFIFFDLASLSLSHSHTIHMVFVLVNTFSLNSTMNDRRIRLHENKWKHFKDSLMKRKKFTIQSQKGLVTFGDLGWSWNSAI